MGDKYEDLKEEMYQEYYIHSGKSKLLVKIWSDALGSNYPEGLNNFGFVTKKDLKQISKHLVDTNGSSLLDIGCGIGGPGLHIAEQHKLELTGIDIVEEAINQANLFKENFTLNYDAKFELGDFCNIPLPDASMDNMISIDAFWMVHDKVNALKEIKRVMKKKGKFIFTTWDSVLFDPASLFEANGFTIVANEVTENWKQYQLRIYDDILKHQKQLLEEIGDSAEILISEATTVPPMLEITERRLYCIQN